MDITYITTPKHGANGANGANDTNNTNGPAAMDIEYYIEMEIDIIINDFMDIS